MHACEKGTRTTRLHCGTARSGGVFAFGHGDFRDIPVKLNNSSGAPARSTFARPAGTNTTNTTRKCLTFADFLG